MALLRHGLSDNTGSENQRGCSVGLVVIQSLLLQLLLLLVR